MGLTRKVMRDVTLSDGMLIPKGTTMGVAVRAVHRDNQVYDHASKFKPFRFAGMCKAERDGESGKHQFVSTGSDYLAFGHGRHAWSVLRFSDCTDMYAVDAGVSPGRFFAATVLKSMMAHVVVVYDVRLEDDTACARSMFVGPLAVPNPRMEVLFRKRART